MTENGESKAEGKADLGAIAMLVCLPAGIFLGDLLYILNGGSTGDDVKRQFVNCYVSLWPFILNVILMCLAFGLSARYDAHVIRIIARAPMRFLVYCVLLAMLGVFVLYTSFLSHQWYNWSSMDRVGIAVQNFLIVAAVGSVYLTIFSPWKHFNIDARARLVLPSAFVLWGYLLASSFRMLPLPYVTGVE